MATAEGNAVADKGSAGADTSVKGVDRSVVDTVTDSDVGATEALRSDLAKQSEYMSQLAQRIATDALEHANRVRVLAEQSLASTIQTCNQINANMADVAQKNSLRAVKMVTDVASDAIAGDIAKDTSSS